MFISRRHFLIPLFALLLLVGIFGMESAAFAQDALTSAGEGAGLSATDPRIIIGNLIRVFLGLLGVIAIVIVIYAGFTWMTAGGSTEKVEKAKKMLINGVIGLVIIAASYAITSFVLRSVQGAVDGTSGGTSTGFSGGLGSGGRSGGRLGGSSSANFIATRFRPTGDIAIRNAKVDVTFSHRIESIADDTLIVLNAATGEEVEGTLTSSINRITFTPSQACPEPNASRFCFDENTTYSVVINPAFRSESGLTIDCSASPCTALFTTGSLIDTADPLVNIALPDGGERFVQGAFVPIQVIATDDSEIAAADFFAGEALFNSIPATGDDLSDVVIETEWDSASAAPDALYRLSVTASDIAGNTDSDSVQIRLMPAHCSNGQIDSDLGETATDCGGVCGICSGGACTESAQCSEGACIGGLCTPLPVIDSMTPLSGAPGTFVTLTGRRFGAGVGEVSFLAVGGGTVEAEIPLCSAGWGISEVTVQVPENALTGPITLTTSTTLSDTTTNESGPSLGNFEVNSIIRPNLCRLSPSSGRSGNAVSLVGSNFGTSQGGSLVRFGTEDMRTTALWSDGTINGLVPALNAGTYDVQVTVGGVSSNRLVYTAQTASASGGEGTGSETALPIIASVTPDIGGKGQYVTIQGSGFGTQIGTVRFESQSSGYTAVGSVDFPDACSDRFWSDKEITVIVPEEYTNGQPVENTVHNLFVVRRDSVVSEAATFTVTGSSPTPGICAISPSQGLAGTEVTISGANFGSSQGSVQFYNEAGASISAWSNDSVSVMVPSLAQTGPLHLTSSTGEESNPALFAVAASEEEALAVRPADAGYGWVFSTGRIRQVPQLIEACAEGVVSAVPNARFSQDICVNAAVYAEFTVRMNEATFTEGEGGNIFVEECTDATCSSGTVLEGRLSVSSTSSATSFRWLPPASYNGGELRTNTTYRVTATTGLLSFEDVALARDVSWLFETGSSDEACAVESVSVRPREENLSAKEETSEFNALPIASSCIVLDAGSFSWNWEVDNSVASIDEGACTGTTSDYCAKVTALAEGESTVTAEESASAISASGFLVVKFTDPYVATFWPDCRTSCANASVGAAFNIPMNEAIEEEGSVRLLECQNELCAEFTRTVATKASCIRDESGECTEIQFLISGALNTGKFHRAIISGANTSTSDVPLQRLNYGADFSWVFQTKSDNAECGISRITLEPEAKILTAIGQTQSYRVAAYGAPDSCSVAGQKLEPYSYDWTWEDPIQNESDVAGFVKLSGELFDRNMRGGADGCTASCTPAGSTSLSAVCGNGFVEAGEECEDGNILDGDGCSSMCLREGSTGTSICGDGIVDRLPNGVGEDCDDGNLVNGDGCSALCLNEGSRALGAVCGNGDVAYLANQGGEDCDDGNNRSGDGCSALCLNEGSRNAASVFAICGDGEISEPHESCDDGNIVNGDGCSSKCIREGSGAIGKCGNGVLERLPNGAGEDCDDGNTKKGDGCSIDCRFEGSSILYGTPSICGDGIPGTGEFASCEVGISPDGKSDPVQMAQILMSATEKVDIASQSANATVRVESTEFSLMAEADLSLLCVAEDAFDCPDATRFGVANNRCCVERAVADLYPKADNACRNATVYANFNQEIDTTTLDHHFYIRLKLAESGLAVCPTSHHVVTAEDLVSAPNSWFAKFLQNMRRFFIAEGRAEVIGECIVPISGFTQEKISETLFEITANYAIPLLPNARYEIVLKGDDLLTDEIEGIRSRNGVSLAQDSVQPFGTEPGICGIDRVEVKDTDPLSPGIFKQANENHRFLAKAYSLKGGTQQTISSIPGIYEWSWGDWRSDSITTFEVASFAASTAEIRSTEISGKGSVIAQARVTVDSEGGSVSEETGFGKSVSGTAKVRSIICNNPWPSYDTFPFEDSPEGKVPGTTEGKGWMHFSLFYCKDSGLPESTIIAPAISESPGIIKEYLLKVNDGSGDAIGIRVLSNSGYLSPEDWYTAQGFVGATTPIVVDGFAGIRAGRSVYVSAPNISGSAAYPNIYVISHNEGAGDNARRIFDQILENISFTTNIDSTGLCAADGVYSAQACTSDRDCAGVGSYCADRKTKVARDLRRLSDIRTISNAVASYGESHGRCSATTSLLCRSTTDCPGVETCQPAAPVLSAGTFVRSLAASEWSSWNEVLGAELGITMPIDPLHDVLALKSPPVSSYNICGEGTFAAYDSATCVNSTTGNYVCPANSYVYHYRSVGARNYALTAELEYRQINWAYPIDTSISGEIKVGGNQNAAVAGFTGAPVMCTGSIFGAEGICGDGVISEGEVCEIGQLGPRISCDADSDGTDDGTIAQICNNSCSGYTIPSGATCTSLQCGNGVLETGEECDDGAQNGRYGFCGFNCTYASAFFCGDGTLAGGEICDCKAIGNGISASGGACAVANGGYSANPANACAWDCRGPGLYCGDGRIDSGEQCDGNTDTYAGKLCRLGELALRNLPCEADADCGVGGRCGSIVVSTYTTAACPIARVCTSGAASKVGNICASDRECDSPGEADGICSNSPVQTTRTKICADNGAGGELCRWQQANWKNIACKGSLSCGNGVLDVGEECDDGNTANTDSCTNECRTNICGDGYIYAGTESCDSGAENGIACSSSYGSTCSYCSATCKNVTASGSFCGDGVINGTEFCDANDVPLSFVASDGSILRTCKQSELGQSITSGGKEYICETVGICNGGTENGELCGGRGVELARCTGGGTCVYPTCAQSCQAACPFTYTSSVLQMQSNLLGASKSNEVNLATYDPSAAGPRGALTEATSATIYFPACSAATGLRADVDFNFTPPPAYVLFVTDTSGSMGYGAGFAGTSPMLVTKEAIKGAISSLFEEVDDMRIGLIRFSSDVKFDSGCALTPGGYDPYGGWCDGSRESGMLSKVDTYSASGGTFTKNAMTKAQEVLTSPSIPSNARKIAILLSDGKPYGTCTSGAVGKLGNQCSSNNECAGLTRAEIGICTVHQDPTAPINAMKNQGIEIYTVALTTDASLISSMNGWSSGNPNGANGVDYAYNANSPSGVQAAYRTLIQSIIGASFGYIVDGQLVPGVIQEGNNVTLPWPDGFRCNGESEFGLPIRVSFEGEGTVNIRNIKLNFCGP